MDQDLLDRLAPTGILYDRVLPLSNIEDHDGNPGSRPTGLSEWRQIYSEIRRAASGAPSWPTLRAILDQSGSAIQRGVIPIAVMRFQYNRIDPDALEPVEEGLPLLLKEESIRTHRIFAAAPLRAVTYRGGHVLFRLDREYYFSNETTGPWEAEADFDDGLGFVKMVAGRTHPVEYMATGRKTIRIRFAFGDGTLLQASSYFDVMRLDTPAPHDTLDVAASIPYLGEYGTGEAYVYLSDGHDSITNPVILVEGFDLDNSMNWDELYNLLNREELIETVRALGFDAVILNFTDATDYLQRNSFVLLELITLVNTAIGFDREIAVAGASMGGLISRYALSYMEANALEHNARTFISFDSPQTGANIPLGLQYWLDFFSDQSEDAAAWLAALDSPASRQLLAYHHTNPPETNPTSDPLRGEFLADLAALGDYPADLRRVAVANGSGAGDDQGYLPGDQIIEWEYGSFLIDIIGNVWAVPDGASHTIFDGLIDVILLPPEELTVTVSGTLPYDNAPGGHRSTMADLDAAEAPYGDIVALQERHCFIPVISALALETEDLFYDIAGDPDILDHTPFDAVYFPMENQEHVAITTENAEWLVAEILLGATGVTESSAAGGPTPVIESVSPNPFRTTARIRFTLPEAGRADLVVHNATGRRVATITNGSFDAGEHSVDWNGSDSAGRQLCSGIYFIRLRSDDRAAALKVLLR